MFISLEYISGLSTKLEQDQEADTLRCTAMSRPVTPTTAAGRQAGPATEGSTLLVLVMCPMPRQARHY